MHKKLPYLIIIIFASLILVGGLLIFKLGIVREPEEAEQLTADEILKDIANKADNPIQKSKGQNGAGLYYQILGKFSEAPSVYEGRNDNAYKAKIMIKDDPLEREIPVILGISTGHVSLGKFLESIEGDSEWVYTSTADINEQLVDGEITQFVIEYRLPPNGKADDVPEYVLELQNLMDRLIFEFDTGVHETEIPETFELMVKGLGVVR